MRKYFYFFRKIFMNKLTYGLKIFFIFIIPNIVTATPEKVIFGAYINDIYAIDFRSGTAEVDIDLWTLSESPVDWADRLEVKNGLIEEKSAEVKKKLGKQFYFSKRLKIKLTQDFKLSKFPIDSQKITIFFQDTAFERENLLFVPDTKNSRCSSELSIHGWKVGKLEILEKSRIYKTNFGDTSLGDKSAEFSRVVVACPLEREGYGYFLKLFSTIFLAAFVAYLGFFTKPEDLDPRFGLGIGGIFAVMASNFVLTSMLPETGEVTFIEATLFSSLGVIFLYLAESVYVLHLCKNGYNDKAKLIDRYTALVALILYIGSFGVIYKYFFG